ncbi:hypothetical protein P9209_17110 [Prescottella defluvii]|nr:hypothetical protein P9209_17110 [Prescottella defluvii]
MDARRCPGHGPRRTDDTAPAGAALVTRSSPRRVGDTAWADTTPKRDLSSTIAAALAAVLVGGTATAYAEPDHSAPAGDRTCVGSNQATMGAIFDAVLQASKPILPQPFLDNYDEIRAEGHRRLDATGISTLAVSNPAATQSSDPEAGINKYGDPITRYLVTQLMNVKNGEESAVIRAENLTLGQAVETAYFLIYTTALVPANIIAGMIPSMVSLGPVSAGMPSASRSSWGRRDSRSSTTPRRASSRAAAWCGRAAT